MRVQDHNNNNNADHHHKKGATTKTPYFVFTRKGRLELAAWPHVLEKIPDPPRFPGYRQSFGNGGDDDDDDDGKNNDELTPEQKYIQSLLEERPVTALSELAFQERWRAPLPNITLKWTSPLRQTFKTRKSAWDHAVQLSKHEVLIDKVLRGYGSRGQVLKLKVPTRTATLEAGRLRFERDGLWVVGQEVAWQHERLQQDAEQTFPSTEKKSPRRQLSGLAYYLQCHRKEHQEKRLAELKKRQSLPVDDTTGSMILGLVGLSSPPPVDVDAMDTSDIATTAPEMTPQVCQEQIAATPVTLTAGKELEGVQPSGTGCTSRQPKATGKVSFTLRNAEAELRAIWKTLSEEERKLWNERAKGGPSTEDSNVATDSTARAAAGRVTPPSDADGPGEIKLNGVPNKAGDSVRVLESPSPAHSHCGSSQGTDGSLAVSPQRETFLLKPGPSSKWCLNQQQVNLCYDESVNHFNQIMKTVKARDLTRELQDGFDLLRERGRGRYDMELPAFDTSAFNFLTDLKKAPWMPVVKEILGSDVVLIHKGVFLSLQDAEPQVYHQDGPHLTTQYQKPCHAINVFVPLVDLTTQGTEFCLSSHILGHEDYDRDFIETPCVSAGTPVIFDYRLVSSVE